MRSISVYFWMLILLGATLVFLDIELVNSSEEKYSNESEIAEEKERILDKKIDEILLDLSDYERDMLYEKLECGDY